MMTRNLTKPLNLIVWLLLLTCGANALAAGLVARLDRTRVVEGDAVVLTLSTSGDADGLPDLTPLQQDFDLVNQGHSTHMQIINGRSSSSREWHLTLLPKRSGKIAIPPIKFGSVSSQALTLEVLPASQAAKLGIARPVLVEVEAEPKQPYVQQKVLYTVRVLFAAPLRDPALSEPRVGDALMQRLGDERRYDTQRNGQSFQVLERRYAILPQHSGELKIAAPVLTARIQEPGQRGGGLRDRFFGRDPFAGLGLSGQTRPIQARGEDLIIDVQPQPPGTASPWLPAESLTLNEVWSPSPPVFRVGEPITRTIAITAQGLAGEQLPELDPAAPAGAKVYPDKSHAETRADKDTLVAQKLIKAALVPSQSGRMTLPEVQVAWWDTNTRQQQVARLPAREVEVQPAQAGAAIDPRSVTSSAAAPARPWSADSARAALPTSAARAPGDATDRSGGGNRDTGSLGSLWPWIALLFGVAWLASTALWLRARRTPALPPDVPVVPAPAAKAPGAARSLSRIEHACRANDPRTARQALLEWAQARWPEDPPRGLEMLAGRLLQDAAPVLQEIDRRLYDGTAGDWDGAAAWRQLSPLLGRGRASAGRHGGGDPLPPLYPTQG